MRAAKQTLAEYAPELIRFWHQTKNLPVTPETVSYGSKFVAIWNCDFGHEYSSPVNTKTSKSTGCPICSNRQIVLGVNDLPTRRPDVVRRWAWDMNSDVSPAGLSVFSRKAVWWTCDQDERHRWFAQVQALSSGAKCAVCHGAQVQQGVNDLKSVFPNVAKDWHPTLNGELLPEKVTHSSSRRVWWQCHVDSRHAYQAIISNRTGRNSGCPVCDGKLVIPGVNDFPTSNPEIINEWDLEKNAPLRPESFSGGSNKRIWWRCENSHVWQASIKERIRGRGCPFCANKRIVPGENDLATLNPELVDEWDFGMNLPLLPTSVGSGSNRRISWICRDNPSHKWKATPSSRTSLKKTGCPTCAKYGFSPNEAGTLYFIENNSLRARKIGITNSNAKTDRLGAFFAVGWTAVHIESHPDGRIIAAAESELLRWVRSELHLPIFIGKEEMAGMSGNTETFAADGPSNDVIIEKIVEVMSALVR